MSTLTGIVDVMVPGDHAPPGLGQECSGGVQDAGRCTALRLSTVFGHITDVSDVKDRRHEPAVDLVGKVLERRLQILGVQIAAVEQVLRIGQNHEAELPRDHEPARCGGQDCSERGDGPPVCG